MSDSKVSLLAAATEEFAARGLHGTRIQAIVQRSGVNERMIYHHFGGKEGLYKAVLGEVFEQLAQLWLPIVEAAGQMSPYEGMRSALAGYADLFMARPAWLGLFMHESMNGWKAAPLPTTEQVAPLRDLYERGQQEGVFRTDIPIEIAHATAISAIFGLTAFAPRGAQLGFPGAALLTGDTEQGHSDFAVTRDLIISQLLDGMTGPRSR